MDSHVGIGNFTLENSSSTRELTFLPSRPDRLSRRLPNGRSLQGERVKHRFFRSNHSNTRSSPAGGRWTILLTPGISFETPWRSPGVMIPLELARNHLFCTSSSRTNGGKASHHIGVRENDIRRSLQCLKITPAKAFSFF
jgi:hypothetical protein